GISGKDVKEGTTISGSSSDELGRVINDMTARERSRKFCRLLKEICNTEITSSLEQLLQVLPKRRPGVVRSQRRKDQKPFKTCIFLGSGGHTMEMIQLLEGVDFNSLYKPRIYIAAENDKLSYEKVQKFESRKGGVENVNFIVRFIPRSRRVGQSWMSTPFSVMKALFASIKIVSLDLPDLIICNGPGSCVPVCAVAYIPR
ncbi:16129_t:CDS:2, partial [Acaulospora morrowiae]